MAAGDRAADRHDAWLRVTSFHASGLIAALDRIAARRQRLMARPADRPQVRHVESRAAFGERNDVIDVLRGRDSIRVAVERVNAHGVVSDEPVPSLLPIPAISTFGRFRKGRSHGPRILDPSLGGRNGTTLHLYQYRNGIAPANSRPLFSCEDTVIRSGHRDAGIEKASRPLST